MPNLKYNLSSQKQCCSHVQKNIGYFFMALLIFSFLSGCAPTAKITKPTADSAPRKLVIFFDGTANNEASNTNIHKLHKLVKAQAQADIGTFYIDGVGANWKVIGMGTGWGIGYRVKRAYEYLTENYRKGDHIYLFGFSRGAYSARILASMLYHAGLPNKPLSAKQLPSGYATKIYDAFKGDMTHGERKESVKNAIDKMEGFPEIEPADVTFLGLWDTVEALGIPNYKENEVKPNSKYGDQLCNVQRAAQALALDDNRARIFTPILLTRPHLLEDCGEKTKDISKNVSQEAMQIRLDETVNEVWFTGAHADVGGGYKDKDSGLSGVSLNWMIAQLNKDNLFPGGISQPANLEGDVHDPEAGLWGLIYHRKWRDFMKYVSNSTYNHGKLKIHESVIERLKSPEKPICPSCEPRSSQWRLPRLFPDCFTTNANGGYDFIQASACQLETGSYEPL